MRQTKYILLFLLISVFLETKAQKTDTSNLYYLALKMHIGYLDTVINMQKPIGSSLIYSFNVEKNTYTTDSIPDTINGFTIHILSQKEIFERTSKSKGIHLISIRPAQWKNGKLIINVIDFGVSRKGKHFYYENAGGSSFQVIGDLDTLKLKTLYQGEI